MEAMSRSRGRLAVLSFCVAAALPGVQQGAVVINEINYHPGGDLEELEFVEILNTGPGAADLSGWSFTRGITQTFPAGTVLGAGALLVVARSPEALAAAYSLPGGTLVVGPFEGHLSNSGEALALSDAEGKTIDEVQYSDEFPWPTSPDGGGPTLECVSPALESSGPRNWLESASHAWTFVATTGASTSTRLQLYLEDEGECLVDDLKVVAEGSSDNLVLSGDFESGVEGWTFTGTHEGSNVTDGEAHGGQHALRIVATGPGKTTGANASFTVGSIVAGQRYTISFHARSIRGNGFLVSRLAGGGIQARTDLLQSRGTPGERNSVDAPAPPPIVLELEVNPALPAPGSPALLRAVVEGDDIAAVTGLVNQGAGELAVPLLDDGTGADELARDGIFTGPLAGAPAGAIVDYRVEIEDSLGRRRKSPVRRYPVGRFDVVSNLPVYHLFIRPADWAALNADIWTEQYFPAVFVHGGEVHSSAGLRFRGGRPRLFRKKSLKLSLDGDPFEGREELNLNAAAMDDDYLSEPLAYWFYEHAGLESSRAKFVRVELNGEFWGLFIDVEQVDERYLERRGLDPEGALYKAVGIVGSLRKLDGITYQGQSYTYESQYEKKTREGEPYDDLVNFIHGLYETPAAGMESYLESNLDVPQYLSYLAASNAMCIWDNIQHNYYFFRDTRGSGRWRVLPWDLDHAWGEWEWVYYFDTTFHPLFGSVERPFAGVWYTWNQLWTVIFRNASLRARYYARLGELLNTRFAEGPIFARIDELVEEIRETALLDEAKWPDAEEPLHTGPRRTLAQEVPLLKQNITRRRTYLARTLGVELVPLAASPTFRRGDADASGAVDLADALKTLWVLFLATGAVQCEDAADFNDDGRLDLTDPIALLGMLYRGGQLPPQPGPQDCGPDPTADALGCELQDTCRE